MPPAVEGDPLRLKQVLLNLLGNALKFTESGRVTLAVEVAEPAAHIEFRVSDTGIGIAPDVIPTLFEPFVQAEKNTARRYGGTGLGLAICHKLAGTMGGSIELNSVIGRGSSFWITVPLPEVPEAEARTDDISPDNFNAEFATKYPLRILVAEDFDMNRLLNSARL